MSIRRGRDRDGEAEKRSSMLPVLLIIINASVFSIGGIGEDQGIFNTGFQRASGRAQIEFTLCPEFNILNEGSDFRNIFWTNPFVFNLRIPATKDISFSLGNKERYNQAFDVYLEQDPLVMHLKGEGGVEEIYCQVNGYAGNYAEALFRGGLLFGSAREVWTYTMNEYSNSDTFLYTYRGQIFSGGIRVLLFSLFFEGLGDLTMTKDSSDSLVNLPERLSIGLEPIIGGYQFQVLLEHSFWSDSLSPSRFKVGVGKANYGFSYFYNPWYLNGIKEHGIILTGTLPISNIGFCTLDLKSSLRSRGSLKEFRIVPEIKFSVEEVFGRRRK